MVKRNSVLLRVRGACGLLVALFAGSASAVGLAGLYEQARQGDPQYASARAEWDAAQTLVTQARGQLLPQVGISGSRTNNSTANELNYAGKEYSKLYPYWSGNGSLNISQALIRPQTWFAYAQAGARVRQAEGDFRNAGQDLILRLSSAYFEALLAQDNVVLVGEQKAAITEQLKQARRYFEAGVGTITDINESQARYDTILAQEIAAQNNREIKLRAIEQIVGQLPAGIDPLGGRLKLDLPEPANVESWLTLSGAGNPVLYARQAALDAAGHELNASRSAHLPTVDVVASRSKTVNPGYTMIDNTNWSNTVGLQFSVPIFSGGATQGRVNQAFSLREKAESDLEATRRAVAQGTRQEFFNVVSGVAQVKALEQAVKSNELALYSAQKGQEAGLRTSFDVLNAQQLLFSAKRDLAQARYAYVLARLRLKAVTGLLTEEDVRLVDGWLRP